MDSARRIATNQWIKARVRPNQLLSKPSLWTTIDYLTVESPNVSAGITFKVERPGTAHGFVLWFDAVLDDGIEFSNAPGERELIYGSAFFPWDQPVVLGPNDQVFIDLRADLVGSDYVWTWNTRVSESNSVTPKVQFRQSTFFGSPIPIAQLRKRNADHRPQLGEDGKIELKTLELMDGTRSNDEITRILAETFRARFIDPRDALPIVTRLAEKYGR